MITFYDSTRPALIPADADACLYVNGPFAADHCQADRFARALWIDVLADAPGKASILDVETGDAQPADVGPWCEKRLEASPASLLRLYCNLSTWPAVRAEVRKLPPEHLHAVRYWIANPTGSPHLVPGAAATQWGWFEDFDQSLAHPRWY